VGCGAALPVALSAAFSADTRQIRYLLEGVMTHSLPFFAVGRLEATALAQMVESLLDRLRPAVTFERRAHERRSLPVLLTLVPLDAERRPLPDAAVTVVGRDVSRRGLSFFHERPLACRRAIVLLAHPEVAQFAAEIDVTWCRFTKPGWYESGGRLLRVVEPDECPATPPRAARLKECLTTI
jgi:hypothetical protein